jgi:exodeoxyribonuclease VII small subunit
MKMRAMNSLKSLNLSKMAAQLSKNLSKLWERGEELAKICQEWLDGAKKKLDAAKATPAKKSAE